MNQQSGPHEPASQLAMAPHAIAAAEVASALGVGIDAGLSDEQVLRRRQDFGRNFLPTAPPRSAWSVLFGQFKSILILILFGAASLAAAIGNLKDALVILAVVLVNATVGFFQEYRAERSLAALKEMLPARTHVRRNGNKMPVAADDLVPGDVVLVEAGDRVPADGRLVIAAGLEVDESALTGESQPVAKKADGSVSESFAVGDRFNMVYMNTLLTRGRAEFIVTATGSRTEMGQISRELSAVDELQTPLQAQLDRLGKRLGAIALTLVGLLAFISFLRGTDLIHIALESIALAVAAMPEGLPVVVTVTLALGMHKMARQKAIVKRLASVETLGCTTVICSDKTGTLTMNQMTVRAFLYQGEVFEVTGEGYKPDGEILLPGTKHEQTDFTDMLKPIVACNDSRIENGRAIGDPMEAALLVLAAKGRVLQPDVAATLPRCAEIAFDAAHKFMATFHRQGTEVIVFVKGAPDVLLGQCSNWLSPSGVQPMTDGQRTQVEREYGSLADRGLRGLLIASRKIPGNAFNRSDDLSCWTKDLTFIGLVGLIDPLRAEAKEAVRQCSAAGIAVKMITGDHKATAMAIARELGLQGRAITGIELDALDAETLSKSIDGISVFARVGPAHKVKIVRALQAKSHVVAMTGDGVNDAPALKAADIGIAMGINGTAVAKEAATMVLVDDNFATIVTAVNHGRTLYDNILKFVRFQLSTTVGAILTVFFAPLAGLPEPFTAVQILWVAIIMDGPPAVSLALDTGRPGIMGDAPRRRAEPILPFARLARVVSHGLIMMAGTLAVLYYGIHSGSTERALTLAFTTFVLFQLFNVFNARNEAGSAFNKHLFDNRMLWLSLAGVVSLQAIAVHWPPAEALFGTTGMTFSDWGIAGSVAATILVLEEIRKLILRSSRSVQTAHVSPQIPPGDG